MKKTPENVQVLVAAVKQDGKALAKKMHLQTDAIIVNQCDLWNTEVFSHVGREVQVYSMAERGVGKSRNAAISHAGGDILLFSDQDIEYVEGYEEGILQAFQEQPEADLIVFNVEVEESRKTFEITSREQVHWYNCGRYGAVSFAVRRDSLAESGVTYSLLFGGGAKYSAGEDSLFLKQFMDKGNKVFSDPFLIGREVSEGSTWFAGYTEKYFFDRGVLYHFLYGGLAFPWSVRYLLAHKAKLCDQMTFWQALGTMRKGIRRGKIERKASPLPQK